MHLYRLANKLGQFNEVFEIKRHMKKDILWTLSNDNLTFFFKFQSCSLKAKTVNWLEILVSILKNAFSQW